MGSFLSLTEVSEVIKKFISSKVPGVDVTCPEMLKVVDIVGLFWLMQLFNVVWRLGTGRAG